MENGEARARIGAAPRAVEPDDQPHLLTDVLRTRESFLKLRADWDKALTAGPDRSPLLEHDFTRLWLEAFASNRPPITIVARHQQRLSGAMGMLLGTGTVDGIPVRLAESWCNAHSARGGLLLGTEGTTSITALTKRALDEPWDVLRMRDVPRENDELDRLSEAFREGGCAVTIESPMDSPYIPLPDNWEALEKRLDARFRQNLRRRRRRLEEHGSVRLDVITGEEGLDAALEDAFSLEAAGWKGQEGSAIRSRPELVAFYSAWARQLAKENKLRLCFLVLGEKRIAFQYAFVAQNRWWLPKCAFDEGYRECSPGQLLMAEVLQRCISEHIEVFEFLGFNMPWKRDWTPLVHPYGTLMVWRPTARGRLARLVRGELHPRVAALWHRWQARREAEST